ncbi:MAG: hypothetical protein V4590_09030 [Bacteroidota bacterium]
MKPLIPFVAFAIFFFNCRGQHIAAPVGAKAWMLGGSSVTITDVWSATNNPAASIPIRKTQYGLYSEQRFSEKNLRLANLSVIVPTKYGQLGGTLNYYGYSLFNQQKIGISLSKALSTTFALGVQLNYVSTFIEQYGTAGNMVVAAGISAMPVQRLRIGFVVFNPTQYTYGAYTSEKIPAYAKLGCAYDVSDKVMLQLEADQTLNQQLSWRGGVYYKIHEVVHLALGAATQPVYYTFGTVLYMKTIKLDMAASFHEVLGLTPHVGCSLPIAK